MTAVGRPPGMPKRCTEPWNRGKCQDGLQLAERLFDALCSSRNPQEADWKGGDMSQAVNGEQLVRVLGALRDGADGAGGFLSVEGMPGDSLCADEDEPPPERQVGREEFLAVMRQAYSVVGRRLFEASIRAQLRHVGHPQIGTPSSVASSGSSVRRHPSVPRILSPKSPQWGRQGSHDTDGTSPGAPLTGNSVPKTPLFERRCWSGRPGVVTDETATQDGGKSPWARGVGKLLSPDTPGGGLLLKTPEAGSQCSATPAAADVAAMKPTQAHLGATVDKAAPPGPCELERAVTTSLDMSAEQVISRRKRRAQTMGRMNSLNRAISMGHVRLNSMTGRSQPPTPMGRQDTESTRRLRSLSIPLDDDDDVEVGAWSEDQPPSMDGCTTSKASLGSLMRAADAGGAAPPTIFIDGKQFCPSACSSASPSPRLAEEPSAESSTAGDSPEVLPEVAQTETVPRCPPEDTIIIFDWDDTLCPTTFVHEDSRLSWSQQAPCFADPTLPLLDPRHGTLRPSSADVSSEARPLMADTLRRHVEVAETVLRSAAACGRVVIVTLARQGWIELSTTNFLPGLHQVIEELGIQVVYARDCLPQWKLRCAAHDNLDVLQLMKQAAMCQCIKRFYKTRPQHDWRNVVSIGDSQTERDALIEAVYFNTQLVPREAKMDADPGYRESASQCRCKTVKLPEEPDVPQLTAELEVLAAWIQAIAVFDGDMDLDFSSAEEQGCQQLLEKMEQGLQDGTKSFPAARNRIRRPSTSQVFAGKPSWNTDEEEPDSTRSEPLLRPRRSVDSEDPLLASAVEGTPRE